MSPFGRKDTIDSGIMCDLPITGIEVILSTRHNMSQGPALVDSKTNKKAGPTNMVVAITCTRKVRRKKIAKNSHSRGILRVCLCVCLCVCWYACDEDAAKCE